MRAKTRDFVSGPYVWPVQEDAPPVVACTADEDMARQEYALKADIRYQIAQFGVGHPVHGGVVNFDHMDLTVALQLVEESQQAWLRLPKVVRDRYSSWANVERAAQTGELQQVLKAAGVPAAVAGAAVASPSDSAAGEGSKPS